MLNLLRWNVSHILLHLFHCFANFDNNCFSWRNTLTYSRANCDFHCDSLYVLLIKSLVIRHRIHKAILILVTWYELRVTVAAIFLCVLYYSIKLPEFPERISVRVIDPFTIKPLDAKTIIDHSRATRGRIITVEDHYYEGRLYKTVQFLHIVWPLPT